MITTTRPTLTPRQLAALRLIARGRRRDVPLVTLGVLVAKGLARKTVGVRGDEIYALTAMGWRELAKGGGE